MYTSNNSKAHCAVALSLLLASGSAYAQSTWTAEGSNTNWSTSDNWSASPSGQNVLFDNQGAGANAGTVTSVVDEDFSIGSFEFSYMNPAMANTNTYQNISIATGKTLTVNGSLSIGATTEPAGYASNFGHLNQLTIGGAGSLVVNGGGTGNVSILPRNTTAPQFRYFRYTTLDMRELGHFSATAIDTFSLGADRAGGPTTISSRVTLSQNNTIQANTLVMDGYSGASRLEFGQSNTVHVDNILIGHQSMDPATNQTWSMGAATALFRPGLSGATIQIRGKDGESGADILVGRSALPYLGATSGNAATATLNLEGGTTDAKVKTLTIGLADQGTTNLTAGSAVNGTVILGAGQMDVVDVIVGRTTSGNTNTNADITAEATLTIKNHGVMDVSGEMILGDAQQSNIALSSIVNLELGTLKAKTIRTGANAAGNKSVQFNWSQNTTIQNHAGSDLTIEEGVDLTLAGSGNHIFRIDNGQTGTVNSSILGAGALAKSGLGTLVLNSSGNLYSGDTLVSEGRLIVNGTLANSTVVLQNEGILVLTQSTFKGLTWNANTVIEADLDTIGSGLGLTSDFILSGEGTYLFDFLGGGTYGTLYTLIHGWESTNLSLSSFAYTNLGSGLSGTFGLSDNALTFHVIPEPAEVMLLLAGFAAIVGIGLRRRKRTA